MSHETEAAIRSKIQAVLDQARKDPAYMQQLSDKPVETFTAAGVEPTVAEEINNEINGEADVRGYRMCDYTTCWISLCDHWGTYTTS
jgi:hypothetical protein